VLVGELQQSNTRKTSLKIISSISRSNTVLQPLLFQFNIADILVQLLADKTIIVDVVEILGNLAIQTTAKTKFRSDGILRKLLDLLTSCRPPAGAIPAPNVVVDLLLASEPEKPVAPAPIDLEAPLKQQLEEKLLGAIGILSLSEANRQEIQAHPFAISVISTILSSTTSTNANSSAQDNELLVSCVTLVDNLFYDAQCRRYFQEHLIMRRLFSLLSTSPSQKLTSQLLSLLQHLTRDDIEKNIEVIRNDGMMPLVSLLSNDNEYVVTQAMLIINNLLRFDSSREMVKTYVEPKTLTDLTSSANATIKYLATTAKQILGL